MDVHGNRGARTLQQIASFIIMAALFSAAYAQSPLYTSNQNQYFLHGLAEAGVGTLRLDWLANTSDPTPVFSWLVYAAYGLSHQPVVFYFFYAILMGVYFVSLLGIASTAFEFLNQRMKLVLLGAVLIVLHSAGLRYALSQVIGINWGYVFEDGLADQRMLGPVFQPSSFGVLLLLAVYCFLKRKDACAGLSIAAACTFHPTYLLAGVILIAPMIWVRWIERHRLRKVIGLPTAALLGVLPILLYVLSTFGFSSTEQAAQAQDILVNFRIPHHARISMWFDETAVFKVLLVIVSLLLLKPPITAAIKEISPARKANLSLTNAQILGIILLAASLVVGALIAVEAITGSHRLALLFPWRISILIIPLAVLTGAAHAVQGLYVHLPSENTLPRNALFITCCLLVFFPVFIGLVRMQLDLDRNAAYPERAMQTWVRDHHEAGDIFLIPVKMQDFRLFSAAPAYIDFKSIPYLDQDVLEWYRRERQADRYYQTQDCTIPKKMKDKREITHVVQDAALAPCPGFVELYSDQAFAVYRVTSNP